MIDFLSESRQVMIDNFQISLRAIRTLMGYTASELADYVGVTRQTINNLETGKAKMSPMQFISIAAVVDNYIHSNGEMFNAIETIIDGNGRKQNEKYDTSFTNLSLIKRWFACFNDSVEFDKTFVGVSNSEEYYSMLQRLANRYKIFVDADVLMMPNADKFISSLTECLIAENAKLIIPLKVVEQIQGSLQDVTVSEKAVKALKLINMLQRKNVAQLRGEEGDSNTHDTILSVFAKFRSLNHLCLITQDDFFAKEIKRLVDNSENQGFDILVGYVNDDGMLALHPRQAEMLTILSEIISCENSSKFILTANSSDEDIKNTEANIKAELNLSGWGQL
jgi:Predicted transcriptional regulators